MTGSVTKSDITKENDPAVSRQYDDKTPKETQFQELYQIIDGIKSGLLITQRPNVGIVSRSMAVARRTGPDLLFLANKHSNKFDDLDANKEVNVSFQNSSTQDWVSITGEATTVSNSDPRIEQVWNRGAAAWFGDAGDGVHTGKADDPRMSLIEVKAKYICYYKADSTAVGFAKELVASNITGGVATTGKLRELQTNDIQSQRTKA